jgi:hypothetical protein
MKQLTVVVKPFRSEAVRQDVDLGDGRGLPGVLPAVAGAALDAQEPPARLPALGADELPGQHRLVGGADRNVFQPRARARSRCWGESTLAMHSSLRAVSHQGLSHWWV